MSIFISGNPYRVIGLPSNSGLKVIQKNISKIKAFSKLNKAIRFDFDLPFLNLSTIDRSLEKVSKVQSRFLLDENKLKYSLFWFQEGAPYDSIAFSNLIKGDPDKALEIWSKATKYEKLTSKNLTAYNNASSLLLLLQLDDSKTDSFKNDVNSISRLKLALNKKNKLITSDYFNEYCLSIGISIDINPTEIQSFLAEVILTILNKNFSNSQLSELINGLDENFSQIFRNHLVREPILNIKDQIKITSENLEENKKQGISLGKNLIKKTFQDIKYLKDVLGADHYQYEPLADKLSNQISQCGIVYFNDSGNDQAYLSSYKYALSIASNEKTKSRVKKCIKHCEDEKLVNTCWFCEKNQISQGIYYKYQMHKWDAPTAFNYNRTYTYFKEGGLKLGCCASCRNRHNETIFSDLYNYFKGIKRPVIKNSRNYTLRRHPLVLKKIREGYEPGLPN